MAGRSRSSPDQLNRCRNELRVVSCGGAIFQDGYILEAGANSVSPAECPSIDRPAIDVVSVMYLLVGDAGGLQDGLHLGRMSDRQIPCRCPGARRGRDDTVTIAADVVRVRGAAG